MTSKTLWTKTLSEEFWSGIVTPLMFSLAGSLIEERMAKKGLRLAGLRHLEHEPFFRLFCGQVYLNSRIFEEIVRLIPSVFITPEVLTFLPEEIREDLSKIHVSFFSPRTFRLLARLFNMDRHWAPFFNYKAFDETVRRIEEKLGARREEPLDSLPLAALIERSRHYYEEMGGFLDVVTWGMVFAYVFHPLTQILAGQWAGDLGRELAGQLTVGLEGIKTFEINRRIELLADMVAKDRYLAGVFALEDSKKILEALKRRPKAREFYRHFDEFIRANGHRFHGRDISYPTWRERPEVVVDMIKKVIGSDRSRQAFSRQKERRRQAEASIKSAIKNGPLGSAKEALFSLSLSYNQKYFVIRENMRYYSDVFLEEFRRIYLEIGGRWARSGLLDDPDEIFYLTKPEVERGLTDGAWVRETAQRRRQEYVRYSRIHTPQVISEDTPPEEVLFKAASEVGRDLRGQVASPGVVRGPARIIAGPEDMVAFKEGEILVSQYADPSWTPILSIAAGMVLEVGGFLSHGSIVAREYGIPALINVTHATEVIKTGDMVCLDTSQGRVFIETEE